MRPYGNSWFRVLSLFLSVALVASLPGACLGDPLTQLPAPGTWAAYPNSALHPAMNAAPGVGPPWNPQYIMDYSGGTYDAARDELIVWGGGHADYAGNEVCRFAR